MGPLGRIGALGCALMLVMAAIPPVVGGTTGSAAIGTAGNEATLAGAGNVPAKPPAALKAEAAAAIDDVSVEKNRSISARDRAFERINGTLDDYRDPVRLASMQSFTDDAVGVQALAKLARSEANVTALRASRYVALADNRTAYQTILDARRALNQTEGKVANQGLRRSAEAHFDNAQRQFDRAQRQLGRANDSEGRRAISQYAQAIRTLRTSWQQAQLTLHFLDREIDPAVTIVNRADPIRNGSETTTRVVTVQFSDPRPWTLGNLTVYVDGEQRRSQPVDRLGNGPMDNRTVGVPVRLSERVANVTVVVSDTDIKPGQNGKQNARTTRSRATLLLDGDGLNESTEAKLGTDPLDPDSDSTETERDESDDGVIDGRADFDRDGLGTLAEFDLGTDPLVADTDDDGLRDGVEQLFLPTDPLDPDTDDDGTLDGAEDRDGDTLTTAEEIEAGSSPFRADTDGDRLSDAEEVNGETNVTDPDTDDDGLLDGVEGTGPFDTDPLNPDTDGDGVLDGNETYTTDAGNESLGISIDVTGEGNVAGATTVRQGDQGQFDTPQVANITATPVVSIQSQRDFERANITFTYEESDLPRHNESRLGVFRWNDTVQGFVPVNSTVDTSANTVSAETSHFSQYAVLDVERWKDGFTTVPQPNRRSGDGEDTNASETDPLDAAFVLDSSGSMEGTDPQDLRATAAKRFVGALLEGDRAAVVDFDSDGRLTEPLTTDRAAVNESIDRLDQYGGTNLTDGLDTALAEFAANSSADRQKVTILLTDGQGPGNADKIRALSREMAERNITLYTVGFSNANAELLSEIANTTGGTSYFAENASQLPRVFSRVATNTTGGTDSDGDGLTDATERSGFTDETLPVSVVPFSTDPNDAQTDADGLSDGAEVGSIVQRSVAFTIVTDGEPFSQRLSGGNWQIHSNPTKVDTDGDGLTDDTETDGWTVPTINRSGQAYRYATHEANGSVHVDSNPRKKDSDGDVITDSAEKFRAHTDPSGDVRYGIAGTLATRAVKLDDTRDSDQDGFPDRQEFQGIPTQVDGSFVQFETDPLNPDTDGDELHDSEEFESLTTVDRDIGVTSVQRDIFPLVSDPTETDSDGDQLSDLAERRFGTTPLAANPDGDQFTDFADPQPYTENLPPEITISTDNKWIGNEIEVSATDNNALERINATYVGENNFGETRTDTYLETGIEGQSATITPAAPSSAKRLIVTAVDDNGNAYSYTAEIQNDGSGVSIVSANVLVAGLPGQVARKGTQQTLRTPTPAGKAVVGGLTIGAVAGSTGYLILDHKFTTDIETGTYPAPLYSGEPAVSYPEAGVEIPPGHVERAGGFVRGYGWAYIQAATELTKEEIGTVLAAEETREVTISRTERVERKALIALIGGSGGPQKVAIVVTVAGAISRVVTQQIDSAVDDQQALDNAEEFVDKNGESSLDCTDGLDGSVSSDDLSELSQEECQTLQQLDITDEQRAGLVSAYVSLSDASQARLVELVERSKQGQVEFLAEADSETISALVTGHNPEDSYQQAILRVASDDVDPSDEQVERVVQEIGSQNGIARINAQQLVVNAGDPGIKLVDAFSGSEPDTLESFLTADLNDADMRTWRSVLAERAADSSSAIEYQDVGEYARNVREIQSLVEADGTEITDPNRVVQETIYNSEDDGQILGQMLEARRTAHYANSYDRVIVDPETSGDGEPDLQVDRDSGPDKYIEIKMVEGDLDRGLKLKDKIIEADGSFNGISDGQNIVVEITAQGEITDDFNSNTPETESPIESFKGIIEAKRQGADIENVPKDIDGLENPEMRVRVIDQDGNVVDGGEFVVSSIYKELNNGN
ncbi:VWA domain-containing protein [Halosimplex litoreum]|uniref:VWA domain-containing protein n=1 Tax=Halosimplex litoreum TaxID=1198301 RepID=A0A7T3FVN5_9EURY|nr:VWA domain-containing protein [Halosimplex litoreum]QPV61591.1 VWA domain-containing protein [Halosimplex litoreum]